MRTLLLERARGFSYEDRMMMFSLSLPIYQLFFVLPEDIREFAFRAAISFQAGRVPPWRNLRRSVPGCVLGYGVGGRFITVFPFADLVVAHKVDIDANPSASISGLGWDAILAMLLDARSR